MTVRLAKKRCVRPRFSRLCISSILILICASGCVRFGKPPTPRPGPRLRSPEAWLTPLPWDELSRVTAPHGDIDAVLVTRGDTGPPMGQPADPTNLHVVRRGDGIPRDPVIPPFPVMSNPELDRLYAETPFRGFDVRLPRLSWLDDTTLLLEAKKADVRQQKTTKTLLISGKERRIDIRYSIDRQYQFIEE